MPCGGFPDGDGARGDRHRGVGQRGRRRGPSPGAGRGATPLACRWGCAAAVAAAKGCRRSSAASLTPFSAAQREWVRACGGGYGGERGARPHGARGGGDSAGLACRRDGGGSAHRRWGAPRLAAPAAVRGGRSAGGTAAVRHGGRELATARGWRVRVARAAAASRAGAGGGGCGCHARRGGGAVGGEEGGSGRRARGVAAVAAVSRPSQLGGRIAHMNNPQICGATCVGKRLTRRARPATGASTRCRGTVAVCAAGDAPARPAAGIVCPQPVQAEISWAGRAGRGGGAGTVAPFPTNMPCRRVRVVPYNPPPRLPFRHAPALLCQAPPP